LLRLIFKKHPQIKKKKSHFEKVDNQFQEFIQRLGTGGSLIQYEAHTRKDLMGGASLDDIKTAATRVIAATGSFYSARGIGSQASVGVQTKKNRNKSSICDSYVTCVDICCF